MCFNMAEAQGFEPWEPFGSLVFKTSALSRSAKLPIGASSRFRTADILRVKQALSPWAKDALLVAGAGIEPTSVRLMRPMTYPEVYPAIKLERVARIELATWCLASSRSTTELHPLINWSQSRSWTLPRNDMTPWYLSVSKPALTYMGGSKGFAPLYTS